MSNEKQLQGAAPRTAARKRRGSHVLSTVLFLAAIAFAAVAVYLYWDEQNNDKNEPTPPPAEAGQYQLAQVKAALDSAGLGTDYGRNTGHTDQIEGVPGQTLKVNGKDMAVFIFSPSEGNGPEQAVAMAEEAYAGMDPATLEVTRVSGEVIGEGEEPHIFQGSNVIVVLFGGDEEEIAQVRTAIEGLA